MDAYDLARGLVSAAELSDGTGVDTGTLTPVQQQFREEVDVENIVSRFGLTGAMPEMRSGGVFADFTEIHDFESAVAKVEKARSAFMRYPAALRERFENDPGKLIQFALEKPEEFAAEFKPKSPAGSGDGAVVGAVTPPAPVVS